MSKACKFFTGKSSLARAPSLVHLHLPGLVDYSVGTKLQSHILNKHLEHKQKNGTKSQLDIPAVMISMQFNSVYTAGKRERSGGHATQLPVAEASGSSSNMVNVNGQNVPLVYTDRGGQITYHGPGQLVSYFVWDLSKWDGLTSRCFVSMLESSCGLAVSDVGVKGVCHTQDTGVWVRPEEQDETLKIGSLGLSIKRQVSSHGISINVNPALEFLNSSELVICGLEGKRQTSVHEQLKTANVTVEDVMEKLERRLLSRVQFGSTKRYTVEGQKMDQILQEVDQLL